MIFEKGLELFASPECDMSISAAKSYIESMKFTKIDVKLVKRDGLIIVEAIRDLD